MINNQLTNNLSFDYQGNVSNFDLLIKTNAMGLIAIEGMQFYAHHGYYKEEQKIGGQYKVDVYLRAKLEDAAQEDILAKTINYENIYAVISEEMTNKSQLIEYVAKKILNRIKTEYENVHYIKVRVSKMNPPLQGNVDRVYVTLEEELEN